MAAAEPIWGRNEQRTREHAFVERPGFPWRSFKPRALCGRAWSPDRVPQPSPGLSRCGQCERVAKARGLG
jgi:hypothetical protein